MMARILPTTMDAVHRRDVLRAAGLLSLGVHDVWIDGLRGAQSSSAAGSIAAKRPPRSCVFIFLFGGQSQVDLWDMKPAAPAEVRGTFEPVATSVPGMRICEHLPLLAQQADKLCLVRSMTHRMPVHGPACSEIYSGRPYFGAPVTDQARPEDWPSIAALVHRFGRAGGALPHSIVLPWYTQFVGQDRRIAGQTGGRMGEKYNPFLIEGNLNDPKYRVEGLRLPNDMTPGRFLRRRALRNRIDAIGLSPEQHTLQTRIADSNFSAAAELVERTEAAGVLDLGRESTSVRERYGRTRFGQSLLMARRLVEAGTAFITVNWDDDHKDDKVSPHWDTHVDNFPKLKDRLCPPFDRGLSAFVEDLSQRGLLDSTLVVALGEFGRTPKIGLVTQNGGTKKSGRDHWPHAFTVLMAGGGSGGGRIHGATDASGGYVADDPVTPADLSATIFRHLGIDDRREYHDHFLQIPQRMTTGRPMEFPAPPV